MQANDKPAFLRVMNGMAAMRKQTLIPEVLDLWWACMAQWTIEDFKAAAIEVLKTSEYMPTPKQFEDLRKATRMTAAEAFTRMIHWARTGGYKQPAKTADAILIDRTVASLGGWNTIACFDPDKLHFLERRFTDNFEQLQDALDTRQALPQLDRLYLTNAIS